MYYCGIDVAKRKHAIALLDEKGQLVQRPFTIENTRAGFDQLSRKLAGLLSGARDHDALSEQRPSGKPVQRRAHRHAVSGWHSRHHFKIDLRRGQPLGQCRAVARQKRITGDQADPPLSVSGMVKPLRQLSLRKESIG